MIEFACAEGAIGWKVNGAGGEGGSVTILSSTTEAKDALEDRSRHSTRATGCSLWSSRPKASGSKPFRQAMSDDAPRL